ncbi:MAG: GGDEF domain-containing protein [Armatimonadetes bacterium]|nr:GGDEF domain-containing protein [Armatimonadota bacterium]
MGLFKRHEIEYQETSWQEMDDEELRKRIAPLIAFLASSLEGTQGLVVSPGSRESKRFMDEVHETIKRLMGAPASASQLDLSRQAYAESAKEFGDWQREQVIEFQRAATESLEDLIACAKTSLGDQGETLDDVRTIGNRLQEAEETGDINKLKDVVREEARRAIEIFETHWQAHEKLQDRLDDSIGELEEKLTAIEGTGSIDYLTECASRAALDFYLAAICQKAQIERKLFSVAMLDMDDFKGINDLWGHQIGDKALNFFVKTLKQEFPTRAFIGRYGGDEFLIVASMDADGLKQRLERLLKRLRRTKVPIRSNDGNSLTLSVSAGVTEISSGDEMELVVRRADEALYEAKRQGKGRVKKSGRRSRAA